jgi:threonine synthase
MFFTGLICGLCGKWHSKEMLQTVCHDCGRPLLAQYDLSAASAALKKEKLVAREASLWRYREILPLSLDAKPVSLGEGWTPLLPAPRFGRKIGLPHVWIKDESQNPTGSFKARGMTTAVSMAKQFGLKALAMPSAGNAAGALAAYAARAEIGAHLFMPKDTPTSNLVECVAMGAHVTLIDGLITDCGQEVMKRKEKEAWFDLSTLKEPYRLEGKKTLGYELAEQFRWNLPDVILYPTGGGTGLIGMWKAFNEIERLGWISSKRPRMVSVQAAGCCPIVTAFKTNKRFAEEHRRASTRASGLRVPKAIGDFLILDALRASGGTAVSVTDDEMFEAAREVGATEGLFFSPEGAACCAALKKLKMSGWIRPEEKIVIFNTAAGLKYDEFFQRVGP